MHRTILFFLVMLLFTTVADPAHALTEIHSIPTRPGVTQDFLLMTPDTHQKKEALIVFTGGNGAMPFRLTDSGMVSGWNFLVRSADNFIRNGLTVVAVRPPSDHTNGMNTDFRESQEHADDISKIVSYLGSIGITRIFLVGNSRGTLSAASLGTKLLDEQIKGIVLTSTLDSGFLDLIPLEKVRKPVLMVHHRSDGCRVSPFQEALKTSQNLKTYTKVDFVEVDNSTFLQMSEPCNDLSSHGFFGMEEKVVKVITDWVDGQVIPSRIE